MSSYIEFCLDDQGDEVIMPVVRITISAPRLSIQGVLDDLIKPALLASGFTDDTINKIAIKEDSQDV